MESSPESDIHALNFNDTELTLRLPGDAPPPTLINRSGCVKRGHSETVDLNLGCSGSMPCGKDCANGDESEPESEASSTAGKWPAAKAVQGFTRSVKSDRPNLIHPQFGGFDYVGRLMRIEFSQSAYERMDDGWEPTQSTRSAITPRAQEVGWPPVKLFRKKVLERSYVKVAVDGAPYLRKVDLEAYAGYQDLLMALHQMFTCLLLNNTCNSVEESKLMDMVKGIEYVPTYEDKDGDWMLVGDVPWKMFKESCKRIRLMKSSKSLEIGQEIPSKCKRTG